MVVSVWITHSLPQPRAWIPRAGRVVEWDAGCCRMQDGLDWGLEDLYKTGVFPRPEGGWDLELFELEKKSVQNF